jgi:hypothetical protein
LLSITLYALLTGKLGLQVLSGEIEPNKVFSTPGMLKQITPKLARFLGPKGLMPTTRRGTVASDVAGAIGGLEGKLEWKGDREGCIRVPIARVGPPLVRTWCRETDECYFAPGARRATIGRLPGRRRGGERQGIPEERVWSDDGEGGYDGTQVGEEVCPKPYVVLTFCL